MHHSAQQQNALLCFTKLSSAAFWHCGMPRAYITNAKQAILLLAHRVQFQKQPHFPNSQNLMQPLGKSNLLSSGDLQKVSKEGLGPSGVGSRPKAYRDPIGEQGAGSQAVGPSTTGSGSWGASRSAGGLGRPGNTDLGLCYASPISHISAAFNNHIRESNEWCIVKRGDLT